MTTCQGELHTCLSTDPKWFKPMGARLTKHSTRNHYGKMVNAVRRLNANAIQIEPYDPCYCGSDKKVKFCHPLGRGGEIQRPPQSNCKPPGPQTGIARSGCYARQLNDCSDEMSGEHLFSQAVLELLTGDDGKVVRTGYPWQREGDLQSLVPANCKANVLCKRHNNALSPLDSTAAALLRGVLKTPEFLQKDALRVLILSGDDIERWLLKTLCTHIVVVRKFGNDWQPPIEWLQILWGMQPFPPGCGWYLNQHVGQSTPDEVRLALRVLTSPGIPGATGALIDLAPYRFALAMVAPNPNQTKDSVLLPDYYRPTDFVITCEKREVVYSFGWNSPVVPRRVAISWTPNPT
jgi:hypothetical protein